MHIYYLYIAKQHFHLGASLNLLLISVQKHIVLILEVYAITSLSHSLLSLDQPNENIIASKNEIK